MLVNAQGWTIHIHLLMLMPMVQLLLCEEEKGCILLHSWYPGPIFLAVVHQFEMVHQLGNFNK
jgi:hypothetical protein